jgi:hypothetical protein
VGSVRLRIVEGYVFYPSTGGRLGERAARAERALGRARPREAWARVPGPAARGVHDVATRGALAQTILRVLSLK